MGKRNMFRIELTGKIKGLKITRQTFQNLANLVFREEGFSPQGVLSISFLDGVTMRSLKRRFFHQDVDTDVIAFLYGEEEQDQVWGEILICGPVALEQAKEQGKDLREEVLTLFVHGLLHLLGYRDEGEEEKKVMEEKTSQLLGLFAEWEIRMQLVKKAYAARVFAYAPYSHFRVGAALLSETGTVFTGCNVENASFGLTVCAERVALLKAVSAGVRKFQRLAIVSDAASLCFPCGACRQVLLEFAPSLEVVSASSSFDFQVFRLDALLPYGFRFPGDEHHEL